MKELLSRTVHTQCAMPTHFHQYDNNSTTKSVITTIHFIHISLSVSVCVCVRAQCGANSRISDNNPTETVHTSMDLIDRFFFILTFLRELVECISFTSTVSAALLCHRQNEYKFQNETSSSWCHSRSLPLFSMLPLLYVKPVLYSIEIAQRVLRKWRSNGDWSVSLSLFFNHRVKEYVGSLVRWRDGQK